MPFIPVPGVCQAKHTGTINGFNWVMIHHFANNSQNPWTPAQAQSLANSIGSRFGSQFQPLMASNVTWGAVTVADLTNQTPAQAGSSHASWTGTAATTAEPGNVSLMINFVIPKRYRGGHPRTYMPPPPTNQLTTTNQWNNTILGEFVSGFAAMVSSIVGDMAGAGVPGLTHCVPTYTYTYVDDPTHHRYHHVKSGLSAVYTVQSYEGQPRVCHQDRRLGAPIG